MIIVSGASRGLGQAVCERLVSKGHEVLGLARSPKEVGYPLVECDVSSADAVRQIAKHLRISKAKIHGVINVAGIASMNLAVTTPSETVEKVVQTNLLGTIFTCQAFAPLMIREKAGRIINFSTIAVALGLEGESVYAASKAGVESFTRSFAREMAKFNITVNCIAPGPIRTNLLRGISDAQISKIVGQQILKREFNTESIADLVEVLMSSQTDSLSGQTFHVGGV